MQERGYGRAVDGKQEINYFGVALCKHYLATLFSCHKPYSVRKHRYSGCMHKILIKTCFHGYCMGMLSTYRSAIIMKFECNLGLTKLVIIMLVCSKWSLFTKLAEL